MKTSMKKIFSVLLAMTMIAAMAVGMTACGGADEADKGPTSLVVYFSATGNTEAVATEIVNQTGADIFKIEPAVPYEEEDLTYDDNCRANSEQRDENARPEIANTIENWDQYDTIYIGHPIWQGTEPRIIDTFMESYDFNGKSIVHFCTSEGSPIDASDANLKAYLKEVDAVTWVASKKVDGPDKVAEWLTEAGLVEAAEE